MKDFRSTFHSVRWYQSTYFVRCLDKAISLPHLFAVDSDFTSCQQSNWKSGGCCEVAYCGVTMYYAKTGAAPPALPQQPPAAVGSFCFDCTWFSSHAIL